MSDAGPRAAAFISRREPLSFHLFVGLEDVMVRKLVIAAGVVLATSVGALGSGGMFGGPGPWITGNDTGGIFPYAPNLEGSYEQIAQDYCARWHRLSKVTSVHRVYGDYVSFVCIDKPWMVH